MEGAGTGMIHGVLPVHKPKGYTSHDIVGKIRRYTKQKRVGHTGTLDPEVEGVLPICLGQATRIAEYIQDMPKQYRGALRLGVATDTEDHTGSIVSEKKVISIPTEEEILDAMQALIGVIQQVPPMYSAVKVNGKRLYELARQGKVVERKAREVQIYDFRLLLLEPGNNPEIHFEVTCSKGTYIRTLCVDLGKKLGYPAHMTSLVRTKSGPFALEDCATLEEIEQVVESKDWDSLMISIGDALPQLSSVIVPDHQKEMIYNGISIQLDQPVVCKEKLVKIYSEQGRFLGIYRDKSNGILVPEKVFREVE